MTTLDGVREATYLRFETLWVDGGSERTPFVFQNEKSDDLTKGDVAWCRLSVNEVGGGQETLGPVGGRRYRRQVVTTLQIFTPIRAGMARRSPSWYKT